MSSSTRNMAIAAILSISLFAGIGGGVALAAESTATAAQTAVVQRVGARIGPTVGRQYLANEVASSTGVKIEDLHALRVQGKSLAQVLAEKGTDLSAFVARAVETRKAAINQLVASGKITQEQANLSIANFEARIETNLNRTSVGPNGADGRGVAGNRPVRQGRGLRGSVPR